MFGFVFHQGVAEGAFGDVLDADVEGRHDVVAVDGFDVVLVFDGDPYAVMEVTLPMMSVAAFQDGVTGAFEAHDEAVVDIAYGADGQRAIGVYAFEFGLRLGESAFEVALVEDGELFHLAVLSEGDVEVDEEIASPVGFGFDEAFFPPGGVAFREQVGQLLAQQVDIGVEEAVVDDLRVDAHLEDGDVGGEQAAVVGQDIAP